MDQKLCTVVARIYEKRKIIKKIGGKRKKKKERGNEDYYSAMAHIWYSTYRAAPPRVFFLFFSLFPVILSFGGLSVGQS